MDITFLLNAEVVRLEADPARNLLDVLRNDVGLTGTKQGCDFEGECGACTVLTDDKPQYSCTTLAVEAEGSEIVTVEGLMSGEEIGEVQKAFVEEDAMQCGYCTSGQIMSVEGLLRANPNPTRGDIAHQVSGNLCRCGAYPHILNAGERAAELKQTGGGES